ncbi:MAG TPA: hypothetical protein VL463_05695 [Kofleriaceae bacterium]|jgi:hypothetical protein|nr:hypothetical protein [Kofleriaceae bacterium]
MKTLTHLVLATAAAAALAPAALAGTQTSKSGGFAIDLPDAWKVQGNDQVIGVDDPSDQMGMLLISVDKSDAKQVIAGVDKLLAGTVTDIHWGKKKKSFALNGMKGVSIDGSAKVKGQPVLTTLIILGPTGTGKGVIAFAGAQPAWLQAHGAEMLSAIKTLRPTK